MGLNGLLEGLLHEEFSDISLYTGEAELFADKLVGGNRIAGTFSAFAREENEHALTLMKIAGKTGGIRGGEIAIGSSLRNCLERHAKREALGVSLYNNLLNILTAPEHKMMIKGIIAQETEHLRAVTEYLRKIRAANEE